MPTITLTVPDDICDVLEITPDRLPGEIMANAAMIWWLQGRVSQGKAAELAGMGLIEFMDALLAANLPAMICTEFANTADIMPYARLDMATMRRYAEEFWTYIDRRRHRTAGEG
jgi:hypothetical protein